MGKQNPDLRVYITTTNGTGSFWANLALQQTFCKAGLNAGSKRIFPSNIAGAPTHFYIRCQKDGFHSYNSLSHIVACTDLSEATKAMEHLEKGAVYLIPDHWDSSQIIDNLDSNQSLLQWPLKSWLKDESLQCSPQEKKLIQNIFYLGIILGLLDIELKHFFEISDQKFKNNEQIQKNNRQAAQMGWQWAKEKSQTLNLSFFSNKSNFIDESFIDESSKKILMNGNTAGALGLASGGASFLSWYPITPASSLSENFQSFCQKLRKQNQYLIMQAEDEIAAASMALGAGYSGARALVSTSGPGLSLVTEVVGFAYFAEVPFVVWDVQRLGPSTGMPTRTAQGDLLAAAFMSHGDTQHPILIPSNLQDQFEMGQQALDISQRYQTPVFVLSDLNLAMNVYQSKPLKAFEKDYDRGPILSEKDLEGKTEFNRYQADKKNPIPYRTLPGNKNALAPYICRSSAHTKDSSYSEDPKIYEDLMARLAQKIETSKEHLPKPEVKTHKDQKVGIIFYGSTCEVMDELESTLNQKISTLKIKSIPFHNEVFDFINSHEKVFIIEQNRDGQMRKLIYSTGSTFKKIHLISIANGLPPEISRILENKELRV